ncbi:MAG: AAA family ATPase [Phenylobacterium sp.]
MPARIVIVSGPPGAGKTTIARRLATGSAEPLAVHLHTDDFYVYIRKGYVAPWLPESQAQNITVMNALARSAAAFAQGGYEVMVDGIVGPWFFEPWLAAARELGLDLRYILLMPDEAATVARGTARTAPGAMTDESVIRTMWSHFRTYAPDSAHIVDTTAQGVEQTLAAVKSGLAAGAFRLA